MTDMLQKSENVAKNVANENSQDLTEQWKKGKFIICNAGKCQYYYVKNEEQQEVIKTEYCLFDDNSPNWKVLAQVPTFDEWKKAYECVVSENEEITTLKELLKQSRIYVKIETEDYDDRTVSKADKEKAKELLTKINEVLNV